MGSSVRFSAEKKHHLFFAQVNLALLRLEPPRQPERHVGAERYGHRAVGDHADGRVRPLGGATEARGSQSGTENATSPVNMAITAVSPATVARFLWRRCDVMGAGMCMPSHRMFDQIAEATGHIVAGEELSAIGFNVELFSGQVLR